MKFPQYKYYLNPEDIDENERWVYFYDDNWGVTTNSLNINEGKINLADIEISLKINLNGMGKIKNVKQLKNNITLTVLNIDTILYQKKLKSLKKDLEIPFNSIFLVKYSGKDIYNKGFIIESENINNEFIKKGEGFGWMFLVDLFSKNIPNSKKDINGLTVMSIHETPFSNGNFVPFETTYYTIDTLKERYKDYYQLYKLINDNKYEN